MTVVWVLVAVGVVALAARVMRTSDVALRRRARPGEGMARPATEPTGDMVDIGEYDHEEATVIYGLLDSNGIPATLRTARGNEALTAYRMVPRRQRVWVAADRVDDARALLSELPD